MDTNAARWVYEEAKDKAGITTKGNIHTKNNYPLSNLYVSMLQRLGIEKGEFSTSKGTMRGLEMA
jgi:hypothetical protein